MALQFELYTPGSSFLYRLDPRVKVLGVLVIFAISVIFTHPLFLGPFFFAILLIDILGGVPLGKVALLLKSLALLVIISLVMWPLLYHPGTEILRYGPIYVTDIGLAYGVGMAFRILNMVIAPISLMLTTTQRDFILALRGLGLPHKGAFALATTFRFVPTVVGVGQTIIEAQKSRGLDVNQGRITTRMRKYSAILGPLIISSLRLAQQLALAVESKGLGSTAKRTSIRRLQLTRMDYAVLGGYVVLLVLVILLRLRGVGAFHV
ncbi:MAG: energy-coupling factor transporter transmembrane protein EcfT [Ardenticatenaceae bacterium]|nr:energy-coupling factor transporter transmembrane protein EcfT [Ardenticatenaceae bacterium]